MESFVRNTNNTSNTNQSRPQTYQPTPMSVNTRNISRPNSNINNRLSTSTMQNNFMPRANNMFKRTRRPTFISEELHYQEEQSTDFIIEEESSNIEEGTIEYENEEIINQENFPQESNLNNTPDSTQGETVNINNLEDLPELPHIVTQNPPLKILINSGASSSIINPEIPYKLFSKFIFP